MNLKYFCISLTFFLGSIKYTYAQDAGQNLRLWYKEPAKNWLETVPLGNGRLGAMPDCGIVDENIVLNEITLWSGAPNDDNREDAFKYLPQIRKLIFDGKNGEAEALVNKTFICKRAGSGNGNGANVPYGSYQVLGDLHLKYDYGTDTSLLYPQNYYRELSLDSAIAKCSYEVQGVTYHREYFISFSNDVIIIRLTADHRGKINFTLSLNRPEKCRATVKGDELDMAGQLNNGTDGKGMRYLARVKIKRDGGNLIRGDSTLQVKSANEAVIYVSAGTDFRNSPYLQKTSALLAAAMGKPYPEERADHIKAYQKLFNRATLTLDNTNLKQAALPTDERLIAFAKNPSDNGLPALYFQYGRYLLISSTRPGLLPPNLQGLWANSIQTPWNGDYHLDINIQMNHWPVEVTNLPMLNQPFYDLIRSLVQPGEKTAKAYYDAKGWAAFSITNIWGYTAPGEDASWGFTASGSGWLCNVLWDHYAFTQDKNYLKQIYPVIKGAAEFYLNTLVKDPNNGWLVTAPSNSPENAFYLPNGRVASVCAGPTIDNNIIRALFMHVMKASQILNMDAAFRNKLAAATKELPPNRVDGNGRLMEWLKPYKETDPHHRHLSPLWGLFPGNEITLSGTPQIADAAKALLVRRGDISTGWSLAWKINLWAMLQDGNHAFGLVRDLLRPTQHSGVNMENGGGTYPNLFDAHPPFQIDGNFGGTAGIANMLVQSQGGFIQFLPALPDQWGNGSFTGLCVRGGGVVSAKWKDHQLQSATLQAVRGNTFRIKLPVNTKCSIIINKNPVKILPVNGIIVIPLQKGETAILSFAGQTQHQETFALTDKNDK